MFRGTVVDSEEKPLEGVRVTITSEGLSSYRKTLTTNGKGTFGLRFQASQTQFRFDFLFEKPGYQSFTQPIAPSVTRQMREKFVMAASESQVVERHGDLSAVVTGSSNAAIEAFNSGLTAQRAGDLGTARAKLEEALAADSSLGPAQLALAQVLLDEREYEAAVEAADRSLSLAGSRAEALQVKHQALRALGRGQEADAVAVELEAAEDAVSTALRVYNEAGELFQADDREAALTKFRRAAELDPSLIDAHHAVATLELAQGNHEASAEAASTALSLGSEDVRTLRVLYDAYDALGRTDEITEIAPRLAAVDPDFGGGKLLEQAADNWNAGQAEKAVRLSRMALAIDPTLAKAHYFIGLDHLGRGENAEAKSALEKFISMAPDDADAGTAKEMLSYIE
ncbi:MAG: hypothetical protein ACE5GX_10155 [Thermoanaerobaculia bacterium]